MFILPRVSARLNSLVEFGYCGFESMNYLKSCRNCGSLERYKNGACKPCAVKKQRIRNESDRMPIHREMAERKIENNRRKEEERRNNNSHYESLTPCGSCGDFMRYVCNGACSGCRRIILHESKQQQSQ